MNNFRLINIHNLGVININNSLKNSNIIKVILNIFKIDKVFCHFFKENFLS